MLYLSIIWMRFFINWRLQD